MDRANGLWKETIMDRYRRKIQARLRNCATPPSPSNGSLSGAITHCWNGSPPLSPASNSTTSFPPSGKPTGQFVTSCLLCPKRFTLSYQPASEPVEVILERSEMLKNLCFHLFLNQEEVPLVCTKANAPLCLSCEEEVSYAWNQQKGITELVERVQKRVAEMGNQRPVSCRPMRPDFEAQKLTNLREAIALGYHQKRRREAQVIGFGIGAPSASLPNAQPRFHQPHHPQNQEGRVGAPGGMDYTSKSTPQSHYRSSLPCTSTSSNLAPFVGTSTSRETVITPNLDGGGCLHIVGGGARSALASAHPSASPSASNGAPCAFVQMANERRKKRMSAVDLPSPPPHRPKPGFFKRENDSTDDDEGEGISDTEGEVLLVTKPKRRFCRQGVEIYKCEDRYKRYFFHCSICSFTIPIPEKRNHAEMAPLKKMELHLRENHPRRRKFTQRAAETVTVYACPNCQPVLILTSKAEYKEHLRACPNSSRMQGSSRSLKRKQEDTTDDDEADSPPAAFSRGPLVTVRIKAEANPIIQTDTETETETETEAETEDDDDPDAVYEIKAGRKRVVCNGVEIYHSVDLAKVNEYLDCSRCSFRLPIPNEAGEELKAELQLEMKNHIRSSHQRKQGRGREKGAMRRKYCCKLCRKEYVYRSSYRNHKNTHPNYYAQVKNQENGQGVAEIVTNGGDGSNGAAIPGRMGGRGREVVELGLVEVEIPAGTSDGDDFLP